MSDKKQILHDYYYILVNSYINDLSFEQLHLENPHAEIDNIIYRSINRSHNNKLPIDIQNKIKKLKQTLKSIK